MKQSEIKKCAGCGEGVMHANSIIFYAATIKTMGIDLNAVRRQAGFEMMMGAAAPLAQVMGPNEDMAKEVVSHDVCVCMPCAVSTSLLELIELAGDAEQEPEGSER